LLAPLLLVSRSLLLEVVPFSVEDEVTLVAAAAAAAVILPMLAEGRRDWRRCSSCCSCCAVVALVPALPLSSAVTTPTQQHNET